MGLGSWDVSIPQIPPRLDDMIKCDYIHNREFKKKPNGPT